ncbi:MAG: cupin [Flavobacteriaceae bacterium]|nr:MAG: cupin [Flavobacteriaceae bacterium]
MNFKLSNIIPKEIIPGYHAKMVHGENMSLAFWDVEKGAEVPAHSHMHEQIMHVLEGSFEFTLSGVSQTYESGDLVLIPSHAVHGGKALTACKLLDVFSPVREEYK